MPGPLVGLLWPTRKMNGMTSPDSEKINPAVTIRFHAPFGGRDNWHMEMLVEPGETPVSVFRRLAEDLYRELREKILEPEFPRFAVNVDGIILSKEELFQTQLKGGEKITILALLVGG